MVDLLPLKSVGALRSPRGPASGPTGPAGPSLGPGAVVDGQLGLLKTRLFSALDSLDRSQLLSSLSSRLETALSLSQESTTSPSVPSAAPSARSPDEAPPRSPRESADSRGGSAASRASGPGRGRDDAEAGAKVDADERASRGSRPSLPRACGPDPYDKLHYKMGESRSRTHTPRYLAQPL